MNKRYSEKWTLIWENGQTEREVIKWIKKVGLKRWDLNVEEVEFITGQEKFNKYIARFRLREVVSLC